MLNLPTHQADSIVFSQSFCCVELLPSGDGTYSWTTRNGLEELVGRSKDSMVCLRSEDPRPRLHDATGFCEDVASVCLSWMEMCRALCSIWPKHQASYFIALAASTAVLQRCVHGWSFAMVWPQEAVRSLLTARARRHRDFSRLTAEFSSALCKFNATCWLRWPEKTYGCSEAGHGDVSTQLIQIDC